MSMITLLDTRSIVRRSIDSFVDFDEVKKALLDPSEYTKTKSKLNSKIKDTLINVFKLQYNLIYAYYNKNTVRKVFRHKGQATSFNAKDLEVYYQHQYLHNHAAVFDEVFEQSDALTSLRDPLSMYEKKDQYYLLFLEESIDILHFLVEYGCLFAEHAILLEEANKTDYQSKFNFPSCLYQDDSFRDRVLEKIEMFIEIALNDNKGNLNFSFDQLSQMVNSDCPSSMLTYCRKILRSVAFKDWKEYPEDFYTEDKFADLFKMLIGAILLLYKNIYQVSEASKIQLDQYITKLYSGSNTTVLNDWKHFDLFLGIYYPYLIYGCYVAKNWINMQRQVEDPRYTGKDFGNIIGVEV